jgi:arsenate reductase (thioredoxin)
MKKVLFLCDREFSRAHIAGGFLLHFGQDEYEVLLAGREPGEIDPLAIKVMEESGIDISGQTASSMDEILNGVFDYVITVCEEARRDCPVFTGEYRKAYWDIDDPPGMEGGDDERLEALRSLRDQIEENVLDLLDYGI